MPIQCCTNWAVSPTNLLSLSNCSQQHSHHVQNSAEETGSREQISCRPSPSRDVTLAMGWLGAWLGGRGRGRGCRPVAVGVSALPVAVCGLHQSGELATSLDPEQTRSEHLPWSLHNVKTWCEKQQQWCASNVEVKERTWGEQIKWGPTYQCKVSKEALWDTSKVWF